MEAYQIWFLWFFFCLSFDFLYCFSCVCSFVFPGFLHEGVLRRDPTPMAQVRSSDALCQEGKMP